MKAPVTLFTVKDTVESAPQQSAADLDSAALLSAPTIDRDGNVYIGDNNQFWAFRPNGRVKWVVDLPPPDSPSGFSPFVTAIITNDGLVGGITMEGKVALYHRATGRLAASVLALPKAVAPARTNTTPTLPFWCGGLVDPALAALLSSRAGAAEGRLVVNTPAVHPQTGRICGPRGITSILSRARSPPPLLRRNRRHA